MPTVLRIEGFRMFFYSNEHLPRHIHVEFGGGVAKFSLENIELTKSKHLDASTISKMRKLVEENQEFLLKKWDEYFD
ncbi:MAG: hypothetical protein Tsb0034_26730 [Ekhidna sp.]